MCRRQWQFHRTLVLRKGWIGEKEGGEENAYDEKLVEKVEERRHLELVESCQLDDEGEILEYARRPTDVDSDLKT